MFGIHYLKSTPNHFVIHHQNGRLRRKGAGLAFFYYKPAAAIAVVPLSSVDVPFIFNETSADFQPLTVQGQLTFHITDPERVAGLLNYTIDGGLERYVSEDVEKLPQRIVNQVQVFTRHEVQARNLRQAVRASDEIATAVKAKVLADGALEALGVALLDLAVLAIRPIPEIGRALEAEARESLLRGADQAIYERRNAAIEQERRIKENELNTELAVEAKQRQLREAKVDADLAVETRQQQIRETVLAGQITLEHERKQLVAARAENARTEADAQAYALDASLRPLRQLDPALAEMLAVQSAEPRKMVSLALKEIAQNAGKIGNLNISPELLENLLQK